MTYLAIDIGASSGKLVRGWLEDGRIETQTVHRFSHSLQKRNGHLCWDLDYIISEIIRGIDKAGPADWISIDTWAVDFLLLGKDGKPLSDPVSYRDSRTAGIQCPVDRNELYSRTGIQFQEFNTIYQLLALQKEQPGVMDGAEDLLFIPDYIAYILTGKKVQEYTNATTTGLVKAGTAEWDMDLIRRLGFNERLEIESFCEHLAEGQAAEFLECGEGIEGQAGGKAVVEAGNREAQDVVDHSRAQNSPKNSRGTP